MYGSAVLVGPMGSVRALTGHERPLTIVHALTGPIRAPYRDSKTVRVLHRQSRMVMAGLCTGSGIVYRKKRNFTYKDPLAPS